MECYCLSIWQTTSGTNRSLWCCTTVVLLVLWSHTPAHAAGEWSTPSPCLTLLMNLWAGCWFGETLTTQVSRFLSSRSVWCKCQNNYHEKLSLILCFSCARRNNYVVVLLVGQLSVCVHARCVRAVECFDWSPMWAEWIVGHVRFHWNSANMQPQRQTHEDFCSFFNHFHLSITINIHTKQTGVGGMSLGSDRVAILFWSEMEDVPDCSRFKFPESLSHFESSVCVDSHTSVFL